jgi:hypothetical protein
MRKIYPLVATASVSTCSGSWSSRSPKSRLVSMQTRQKYAGRFGRRRARAKAELSGTGARPDRSFRYAADLDKIVGD